MGPGRATNSKSVFRDREKMHGLVERLEQRSELSGRRVDNASRPSFRCVRCIRRACLRLRPPTSCSLLRSPHAASRDLPLTAGPGSQPSLTLKFNFKRRPSTVPARPCAATGFLKSQWIPISTHVSCDMTPLQLCSTSWSLETTDSCVVSTVVSLYLQLYTAVRGVHP